MARKKEVDSSIESAPGTTDTPGTSDISEIADASGTTDTLEITGTSNTLNTNDVKEVVPPSEPKGSEPVSLEIKVNDGSQGGQKTLTKEGIEASVIEKLSRRSEDSDPFVPNSQLDKEVTQVSKEKGFPLSRGTEVGARLFAKARRNMK